MSEFVEINDCDLVSNNYYFVLTDSGKWSPILLNLYNQWVVGDMFLPKQALYGLRKIPVNMPPRVEKCTS